MVLLVGCSTAPVATTSPPVTAAPTAKPTAAAEPTTNPTETPAATQAYMAEGWISAAPQAAISGAQFQDVVWTGQRFVAAGIGLTGGGVFVSSADGQRWLSVPSGGTSGYPTSVTAGANGVVAVGTIDDRPASWISADGRRWTYRVGVFPTALKDDDVVRVTDVVATTTGWLAVGRDDPICQVACGQNPRRALAWTSSDAETWTRVPAQASLSKAAINAVAAIDGGLVGVGQAAGHAAFWTSADGLTWTRVQDDPIFGPPPDASAGSTVSAVGVAASGGTIVAVGMAYGAGSAGAPIVEAWRSTDGRTWTRATVDNAEEGQVFAVAATAGRFLATGPSGETSCLGGIWSSTDGATWACAATDASFAGFGPYAAAGSPALEVAVGLTDVGWDPNGPLGLPGAIWWRPIP
jgi:hypothetical protein